MKKAIFFDLDGTILNTLEDLRNAVNFALKEQNFPLRSLEEIRLFIGNGTMKLVERSCPKEITKEQYDKAYKTFSDYYANHSNENTIPYEGVIDVLKQLKSDGYFLAVISNKLDVLAKPLIEEIFPNIFDHIQGSFDNHPKKPDPYLCQLILDKHNFDPKDVLYFGDGDVDYKTATSCGIDFVLVSYGYRTKEELAVTIPGYPTIDKPSDIYKSVKNAK